MPQDRSTPNPRPLFKNQHSVKPPCCTETLQRISPQVTVWSFSWLAAIAYNEGIINFCFKGIGDQDMDTAWLYHLCSWHILIHTIFPSVLDTTEHQRSQSTLCWNSPKKQVFIQFPVKKTLWTTFTENGSPLQLLWKQIQSPQFGLLNICHTRWIIMTNITTQQQIAASASLNKRLKLKYCSWNRKGLKERWKLLKF